MRLPDRAALVTGGASGIGAAICRALAAEGAMVLVADIAEEAGRGVADELPGATFVPLDVTNAAQVGEVVAGAGAVDILVNCAGADVIKPFIQTDEALWTWLVELNFLGFLRTTHAVLPGMVERGRGRIVNIASDAGRVGSTGEAVYSGCKGGMIAFTKSLAREVARNQVTVNAVCPGPTDTPATRANLESGGEKLVTAMTRAIPLGRLGEPADVAAAVAFLASDDACFITGQTLSVSGGLSMV